MSDPKKGTAAYRLEESTRDPSWTVERILELSAEVLKERGDMTDTQYVKCLSLLFDANRFEELDLKLETQQDAFMEQHGKTSTTEEPINE
jgi:hypothetical protein